MWGLLKLPVYRMQKLVLLLSVLSVGGQNSTCKSRRCLAEMLSQKELLTQPYTSYCGQDVNVTTLEYTTLSVDTKNYRLNIRLKASMVWEDPELRWDYDDYPFYSVFLPVNKVWIPEINLPNALETQTKHDSKDVHVDMNGYVEHTLIINAKMNCEVNLFNYPFAGDECPVAIQTWGYYGCGTVLNLPDLTSFDWSRGDWKTTFVTLNKSSGNQDYIRVGLSIKPTNPFITLMMPSILIILADFVSFALPLTGGERNCFKVTLVLSFTLFLNILNDQLPGDSKCGPVIRVHFCVCLVMLVVSMLGSMMLTRVASEGGLALCCCSKGSVKKSKKDDEVSAETSPDITIINLDPEENSTILRKVGQFLDGLDTKERESVRHHRLSNFLDKIFFWIYFILGSSYFMGMICVMAKYQCDVNHFDYWNFQAINPPTVPSNKILMDD